ncbi:sensor histidine kinase [Hyphomonas sp.]|uniref:sensor histidine kinase n=1 Tax=Hyphomonas sp. TaxID=87 RepID=UPI003918B1CB
MAIALSPLLVLGTQSALSDQAAKREQAYSNGVDDAKEGLAEANAALRTARTTLSLIASEARRPPCTEIGHTMTAMDMPIRNVIRFGPDGTAACSFIGEGLVGQTMPGPDWNQSLRMGADQIESSAYPDMALNEPVIWLVNSTLDAEGNYDGALAITISLEKLAGVMPAFNAAADREQALVTARDGVVVGSDVIKRLPLSWLSREAALDHTVHQLVLAQGRRLDVLILPAGSDGVLLATFSPATTRRQVETYAALFIPVLAYLAALFAAIWIIDVLVLRWLERLRIGISCIQTQGAVTTLGTELAGAPAELRKLAGAIDTLTRRTNDQDMDLRLAQGRVNGAFRETHHRVKNNLQVMLSMLKLQVRNAPDPDAQIALRIAAQRVSLMAAVHHSLLNETDPETVDARDLIEAICYHIQDQHGWGEDGLHILPEIDDCKLASSLGVPLAMFIQEGIHLVCPVTGNTADTRDLELWFTREGAFIRLRLSCGQNTPSPEKHSTEPQISPFLMAFARQMDGTFEHHDDGSGTATIELTFPLVPPQNPA